MQQLAFFYACDGMLVVLGNGFAFSKGYYQAWYEGEMDNIYAGLPAHHSKQS